MNRQGTADLNELTEAIVSAAGEVGGTRIVGNGL